jgi:methylmalonyl-CoA/ethylmalonyl-CoA epimerase
MPDRLRSTPTSVRLDHITQIALTVRDLGRARAFYADVLGMRHLFNAGTMEFFECGSIRLMLGVSEQKPITPAGTILYFKVQDIHATHATLRDRGVFFLQPPHLIARMPTHDLWLAVFKDLDDNTLAIMGEIAPTAL